MNNIFERKAESIIDDLYDWAIENQHGDCDDCEHNVCWDEHHPYGSTTAAERLCECRAKEAKDCPVVESVISTAGELVR